MRIFRKSSMPRKDKKEQPDTKIPSSHLYTTTYNNAPLATSTNTKMEEKKKKKTQKGGSASLLVMLFPDKSPSKWWQKPTALVVDEPNRRHSSSSSEGEVAVPKYFYDIPLRNLASDSPPPLEPSATRIARAPSALSKTPSTKKKGKVAWASDVNDKESVLRRSTSRNRHTSEKMLITVNTDEITLVQTNSLTLGDLPSDMVKALADVLPSDAESDTPLANIPFVRKFATESILDNPSNIPYKKRFLQLLEVDVPEVVLCRACKVLHRPQRRLRGLPLGKEPLIRGKSGELAADPCATDRLIGVNLAILPTLPRPFLFSQLQLAMKKHRMRLNTTLLLQPLNSSRIYQHQDWVHLWTSRSKIVDDRLFVRTQHWYVVPIETREPHNSLDKILRSPSIQQKDSGLCICKHERSLSSYANKLYHTSQERGVDGLRRVVAKKAKTTGMLRCRKCSMEFQLDAFEYRGKEHMCVITAWRDLGRCMSAYDMRFRCHFCEYGEQDIAHCGRLIENVFGWRDDEEGVDFHDGTIKSAFEGNEEFNLEECLEKNDLAGELRQFDPEHLGERELKRPEDC